MKRGELVEVRWPNAKEHRLPPRFHALIVGKAGDNLIVMDAKGTTFQPMAFSCHRVVLTEALKELRASIAAIANSDVGKAAIIVSRMPPTAVYRKTAIDGRMVRHEIEMPIAPGPGHGFSDYRAEPMVLAEGRTSHPTESLLKHVDFWGDRMDEARRHLSPALQEAMVLIVDEGLSYHEAGWRLGVPPSAVWSRMSRARAALRRSVGTSDELLSHYSARRGEDVTNRG